MRVLVVNAGSSTLKLSVVGDDGAIAAAHTIEAWDGGAAPIQAFVDATDAGRIDAVGHRVVHGGTRFTEPTPIDDRVVGEIDALTPLAPLHQPRALAGIRAARSAVPSLEQFACFDTAFHATLTPAASTYALPAAWRDRWPLRRFGFHGLSHAYASRRTGELAGRPLTELSIISCHLGAGASLCAIDAGRSVDTTMGFTPLDGLVMATRSGSVDPGLITWLIAQEGLSAAEVNNGLEQHSGLFGLCGTADMREVIARRARGDADATLAFDVYTHSLRRSIGAMSAALARVDALVFTGGVGEHAAAVRAACGLALDDAANAATTSDGEIGAGGGTPRAFVVTAREDAEIAAQVRSRSSRSR